MEVLRAEVDYVGYDLVLGCNRHLRHIQLKSSHSDSTTPTVNVHIGLMNKPSACIIWIKFDSRTLALGPFLWFGSKPGEPIPELGDRIARHTRRGRAGTKAFRPNLRIVKEKEFRQLRTIDEVVSALFGLDVPGTTLTAECTRDAGVLAEEPVADNQRTPR